MYSKNAPHKITATSDKTVYICQCGKTADSPLCDGSHSGSNSSPLAHNIKAGDSLFICGCGKSKTMPFCDGSHKKL
jgi:CDGSH-type Zn-finger protein